FAAETRQDRRNTRSEFISIKDFQALFVLCVTGNEKIQVAVSVIVKQCATRVPSLVGCFETNRRGVQCFQAYTILVHQQDNLSVKGDNQIDKAVVVEISCTCALRPSFQVCSHLPTDFFELPVPSVFVKTAPLKCCGFRRAWERSTATEEEIHQTIGIEIKCGDRSAGG